tara:strand:- start:10452 stop:11417 length:966 start_codon:yes stop_codon:yes gene_type:complete
MWEWLKDFRFWIAENIRGVGIKRILLVLLAILLLYYPIGMIVIHVIDDDRTFRPANYTMTGNASYAVAMSSALIDREVNQHSWISNDPFFYPSGPLDNMANYQQGIIAAIARFSFELVDQLGRTRGSSKADPDLQEVSGLLQYPADKWWWDPSVSLLPVSTSEAQYRSALKKLRNYNQRLAAGEAVFERRGDNLLATLDRIALDLGASSAALDKYIREGFGCVFDMGADDLFYNVKGQAYAYSMILKALRQDFEQVIKDRELNSTWNEMEESFASVVDLDPTIVSNCQPDGMAFPNHLAAQGFYLLRARTQLKELTNILLK